MATRLGLSTSNIAIGIIIQVRPSRNPRWQKQGGWEVDEAEGVCPVYCDERARGSAFIQ